MDAITSAISFVDSETGRNYTVRLIVENQLTDDPSRRYPVGPIGWRDGRLPFTFSDVEGDPHEEARHVGNLFNLRREQVGDEMWVVSDLDWDDDELAQEAKRLVDEERIVGVSIRPSDLDAFLICGVPEPSTADQVRAMADEFNPESCPEEEWTEAWVDIVIGSATLLMNPAFEDAKVVVASDGLETAGFVPTVITVTPEAMEAVRKITISNPGVISLPDQMRLAKESAGAFIEGVLASVDLARPPGDWFIDPHLEGPTPLTITDEGRVSGHLALWDTCHRGFDSSCITPPREATEYAEFHDNARVMLESGELLPVGCLTVDVSHADVRASVESAKRHYDHSGTTAAFTRAGADNHGVWLAGAVAPWATQENIEKLRRLSLSGDWRPKGGSYFLIAAQAVPVPGFPIRAKVASGVQTELTTVGPVNHYEADSLVASLKEMGTEALIAAALEATNLKLDEVLGWIRRQEAMPDYEKALAVLSG